MSTWMKPVIYTLAFKYDAPRVPHRAHYARFDQKVDRNQLVSL